MSDLDQIRQHLDHIEEVNPDPAYATSAIKDLIALKNLNSGEWLVLIERYGGSKAQTIVAALAWCLADDADRSRPQVGIEEVLRFSRAITLVNSSAVSGALAAVAERIRPGSNLRHDDVNALRSLLLKCFSYTGDGSFQVEIGVLDLLERLHKADLLTDIFDAEHRSELYAWLTSFLNKETEGPFAEQAQILLHVRD